MSLHRNSIYRVELASNTICSESESTRWSVGDKQLGSSYSGKGIVLRSVAIIAPSGTRQHDVLVVHMVFAVHMLWNWSIELLYVEDVEVVLLT